MSVARSLLAAIALAFAAGCGAPLPFVARGEAFTTGQATYDEFFTAVRQLRSEALAAANDEATAHAGLVKALGLEAATKRALAVDESGLRAKRFQEKGVLIHLELTPDAQLLTARNKVDLGPDGETLLRAMEDAARTGLDLRKRFVAVAARADDLEKRRVELRAKAPSDFREGPQAKRDEIVVELDAAQGVLADAAEKANRAAGAAARFAVELAQAVETGAEEAARPKAGKRPTVTLQPVSPVASSPPAAPAAKPAAPAAKPAAAAPAPKPAGAAPAPAAPPPKKKGGGDDFEP
ncbi:SSU ribosomal protein S2p (SAe) [Minicystis rosea]|nr:SSU ribosomal protein S2p (SAe) [Minicystis rosea]